MTAPTPNTGRPIAPAVTGHHRLTPALQGDWARRAACKDTDPEVFFNSTASGIREAKRVCGPCPVALECLAWAHETGQVWGTWGGRSAKERRRGEPLLGAELGREVCRDAEKRVRRELARGKKPAEVARGLGVRTRALREVLAERDGVDLGVAA